MEAASTLNLNKICRVCLTEGENMISIFSEIETDDNLQEAQYIYEILMEISSMKIFVDDGLPPLICGSCTDLARTLQKFQQQCNRSQLVLEAYISQEASEQSLEETNEQLTAVCDQDLPDFFKASELTIENVTNTEGLESSNSEDKIVVESTEEGLNDIILLEKEETVLLDSDLRLRQRFAFNRLQSSVNGANFGMKKRSARLNVNFYIKETPSGEKVYACNLCEKMYKYGSSLKIHMRTHTLERPYKCTICGKDFKQYGSLVYHNRSHTGEQPYSCEICGKRYKQSGTLTAHMRVHTGQRPFLCSVCGRGFRQAPDLGYHMRTHTKEKPYMCNICGKTMSMQCHLVQHMRTHTGERPFKCTECNKAFPSSTRLKRHAIIHTGLKPYTCDVCDKSFNRSSSLRVHAKIHTDERPHVCPICGKGFIQAHALRGHVLTHSSDQYELTVTAV